MSFTPSGAPADAPATEIAENQEVNGEVSETGQVQVQAPSVMSPADQQQLNATAEQAVEASDDTSVAEASNAAAETTQQVQSEVDNGAPAEPAAPPASDPAEEPEPAPEPEPTPSPEDATDTQPAAEPAVEADNSIDPSSVPTGSLHFQIFYLLVWMALSFLNLAYSLGTST